MDKAKNFSTHVSENNVIAGMAVSQSPLWAIHPGDDKYKSNKRTNEVNMDTRGTKDRMKM